jgi:hypothetical protein
MIRLPKQKGEFVFFHTALKTVARLIKGKLLRVDPEEEKSGNSLLSANAY